MRFSFINIHCVRRCVTLIELLRLRFQRKQILCVLQKIQGSVLVHTHVVTGVTYFCNVLVLLQLTVNIHPKEVLSAGSKHHLHRLVFTSRTLLRNGGDAWGKKFQNQTYCDVKMLKHSVLLLTTCHCTNETSQLCQIQCANICSFDTTILVKVFSQFALLVTVSFDKLILKLDFLVVSNLDCQHLSIEYSISEFSLNTMHSLQLSVLK